jgi:hypothetical protein
MNPKKNNEEWTGHVSSDRLVGWVLVVLPTIFAFAKVLMVVAAVAERLDA